MNAIQTRLIQEHWAVVKDNSKLIGRSLYEKLFYKAPFIRHLFNEDITEQSCKLAAVINFVVSKLHRLDDILTDIKDIGRKHRQYKLTEQDFKIVGDCLFEAIKENDSDLWNEKLENAWKDLYTILMRTMMEAGKGDT